MNVAVVGAGIMGSAAARELARSGHEVTLYEQFRLGHSRGSSHGRSRIVRLAYPELEFVELAREAFRGWRELEHESGLELLELSGGGQCVAFSPDGKRIAAAALVRQVLLWDVRGRK